MSHVTHINRKVSTSTFQNSYFQTHRGGGEWHGDIKSKHPKFLEGIGMSYIILKVLMSRFQISCFEAPGWSGAVSANLQNCSHVVYLKRSRVRESPNWIITTASIMGTTTINCTFELISDVTYLTLCSLSCRNETLKLAFPGQFTGPQKYEIVNIPTHQDLSYDIRHAYLVRTLDFYT